MLNKDYEVHGIKQCQAYRRQYGFRAISLMPTNLYGPGDNFDLQDAHVLPALLHRFHRAKQQAQEKVVVWGTGTPAGNSCTRTTWPARRCF